MTVLELKNVGYRYRDAKDNDFVFQNLNYTFELGKIYAIRGKSGTGKTTLLSLLSGLEKCDYGTIAFDGKDLRHMNLDSYRSHQIGIVFQSFNLLSHLTAIENIILSMDISGNKSKYKRQEAIELLKKVGLNEKEGDRRVLKLSGGEQQRVAIARSLSYNPKIILADEPTGNLDAETENDIMKIFKNLAKEGKCIIIVTHSNNVASQADLVFSLAKENKKKSLKKDKNFNTKN